MPDGAPPLIDFSQLGNLVNDYRQAQQYAEQQRMLEARKAALAPLANSTDAASLDTASRQLLASGDLQGGISLSAIAQKYGDRQAALELSKNFSSMFGGQPSGQPQGVPAPTSYNQRLTQAESGGDPNAQASTSSARGLAQFTNSTWIQNFDKTFPQQASLPADQKLALRSNPNVVTPVLNTFTQANEGALSSAGIPVTDATRYAAHFFGAGDAIKVLKASPDTPLSQIVQPASIQANPFLAKMTAGQAQQWLASKMGGDSAPVQTAPQGTTQNQAPQAMFAGRPMDQWVRGMAQIATNPNAPKEIQQFATEFVKGAISESGLTPKQKDYRTYVQQEQSAGRPVLSFNDWDQQGKQTAGESALDKGFADTYLDIQKQARDSRATTGTLETLGKLTTDPRFYSGTGGGYVTQAKRLLSSMGVAAPDSAQPNELFEKLANKLVLDTSGGSLGTGFSNADRDFMQRTVANINNTPEGNRAILQLAMAVEQRKQQIAQIARDYVKTKGGKVDAGLDQVLSDYAEKNPLFGGPKSGTYSGAGDWQDAPPPIANAIGAQAQPSPAPVGGIQEGMTATNTKTGQKIIFRAGKWEPVPTGPAT